MAVSKAQQKAVNKYMAANYDRINLTVPKGKREEIKEYAETNGESVNGFINRAIDEIMGAAPHKPVQNAAEAFGDDGAVSLTPETLQVAREVVQNAGEAVSAFVERTVDTQAKRDKMVQGLKKPKE